MTTIAIIFMLAGVMTQALHGVLQRYILKEKILSKRESLLAYCLTTFLVALSALWWWSPLMAWIGLATSPQTEWTLFWIGVGWATLWNFFIQWANVKSKQAADVSLVTPFQALTPGLITMTMLVFHEYPSTIGWIGIIMISFGTYVHAREGATTLREWFMPLHMVFWLPANFYLLSPEHQRQAMRNRTAVRWAVASAFAGTMGLLGDSLAARHGEISLALTAQFGIMTAGYLLVPPLMHAIWPRTRTHDPDEPTTPLLTRLASSWPIVSLFSIAFAAHYFFISSAYRLAPVAYIGSLKRLSIFVALIFAWLILGESKGRRFVTGTIITIGALLISLDPHGQASFIESAHGLVNDLRRFVGL